MQLKWTENISKVEDIAEHFRGCAPSFVTRLSRRVDLEKYSQKLFERARRFEAWDETLLVGLVAAYFNGSNDSSVGFLSNVSVLESHKGQGIASNLLTTCQELAVGAGLTAIRLEVDSDNAAALSLYNKMGYIIINHVDDIITMQRQCGITR